MNKLQELEIPDFVNDADLARYRGQLDKFLKQEMDADRFTAARLQMGVYGQRQTGVHMVRIKLPGGRISPSQLRAIGEVIGHHTPAPAHVTTRQDFQLHDVPLADTPQVLQHLSRVGLTTREACGNTVRNVTSCALSGVCPREHVDVQTHLEGAVAHFLRYPLNQQMPRKFKISFSGCEADCAQSMMHDLGLVATRKDGKVGFMVKVGGGLGHKPREASLLAEFIEEKDLLPAMEAVLTLHERHSNREQRAKARIKFLVEKLGIEEFRAQFQEVFSRSRAAMSLLPLPTGNWRTADGAAEVPGPGAPRHDLPQHQPNQWVVPLSLPTGDLTAPQLLQLADILEQHGIQETRTTQDQNLLLLHVPNEKRAPLIAAINKTGLGSPQPGDDVVACPGTTTCRLGVTSSMNFAPFFRDGHHNSVKKLDLRLRVSGCHNGCAQPETGDIGIYGEGRRRHGHLLPFYQFYIGGSGMAGGGLALKGPEIPAARADVAIERLQITYQQEQQPGETFFQWSRRRGIDSLKALLADLAEVKPEEALQLARDHGEDHKFQVVPLGGGECAGAVQMQIAPLFFESAHEGRYRGAFLAQQRWADVQECLQNQITLLGRGLAQFLGMKLTKDIDISASLTWLHEQPEQEAVRLSDRAVRLRDEIAAVNTQERTIAKHRLEALCAAVDTWLRDVARLVQSKDASVDLEEALPTAA